jgi:ribonuclease-3 family protein
LICWFVNGSLSKQTAPSGNCIPCLPTWFVRVAQAQAAEKLAGLLREEETAVYKRGRNARSGHSPKSATSAEYHAATGLEALFGWLYLKGDIQRVKELFEALCEK